MPRRTPVQPPSPLVPASPGRPCLRASATPIASGKVEFSIVDTGPGISPEQLQRIGGMLVQGDASSARRFGGMGLGLPIARRLIELMGGELGIKSELGSGSTFHFTLPFALTESDTETDSLGA